MLTSGSIRGRSAVDKRVDEMYGYLSSWSCFSTNREVVFDRSSGRKLMSVCDRLDQDGVVFSRSIRALARQAREVIQGQSDEMELQDLLDRIETLEDEARSRGTDSVGRWLTSLRRLVEDQVLASA
jgi:hypothetical protein